MNEYDLEMLITLAVNYAKRQQYCWFRFTYSKIGDVKPVWMVWFENIAGVTHRVSDDNDLKTALEKLLKLVEVL